MTRPMTKSRAARPRGPGRPAGGEAAVRGKLLTHARKLFLQYGFDAVGTRQIAAAAGTTPAMIRYYFTDKFGLYRAMVEVAIAPVLAELQRSQIAQVPDVDTVLHSYMKMLAD